VTSEELLATGDAVNVAARLEQAAKPGEVLLGAETIKLLEQAIVAEPVAPLELKGKRDPVQAFRLIRRTGTIARRPRGSGLGSLLRVIRARCPERNEGGAVARAPSVDRAFVGTSRSRWCTPSCRRHR
jgi:hypothetical protein